MDNKPRGIENEIGEAQQRLRQGGEMYTPVPPSPPPPAEEPRIGRHRLISEDEVDDTPDKKGTLPRRTILTAGVTAIVTGGGIIAEALGVTDFTDLDEKLTERDK